MQREKAGGRPKSDMTSKKEFMALNNINKGSWETNHPSAKFIGLGEEKFAQITQKCCTLNVRHSLRVKLTEEQGSGVGLGLGDKGEPKDW